MLTVDLNCDMGESTSLWPYDINYDISLLSYVSSINLACGSHAGDEVTAKKLINEALTRNVSVGAHPSFPDRQNFGRKEIQLGEKELYQIVYKQIEFLGALAISNGVKLKHVKPHGALYNQSATDQKLAFVVCSAIQAYDDELMIYGLSGSELVKVADSMGLKSCSEVFADRTYKDDGNLTPRNDPNALLIDEQEAIKQVLQMVKMGTVTTTSGNNVSIKAETICIHSDGKNAFNVAKRIHEKLLQERIAVSHP
jgi:UPF0271 protein